MTIHTIAFNDVCVSGNLHLYQFGPPVVRCLMVFKFLILFEA